MATHARAALCAIKPPEQTPIHAWQVFYVRAPVVGTWKPNEERTFYFYVGFALTAGNRVKCIPFRAGNAGLVCVAAVNQHAQEYGRIALKIRNTAAYNMPDWQVDHRFGVQVGP
jgi:hypothetical protein